MAELVKIPAASTEYQAYFERPCIGFIGNERQKSFDVYNLGLKTARQKHWPEPSYSLHRALWDWCQKQADKNIKTLGISGSQMYALRIESDYKDRHLSDSQAVHKQLRRARDFEVCASQQNGQQPPAALPL